MTENITFTQTMRAATMLCNRFFEAKKTVTIHIMT